MHGTHQFFMTSRSLYLILLSARENAEDSDAEYWLSLVRSLAGNVPIIVILNKFGDLPFEVNRSLLRDKFGKQLLFAECDSRDEVGIQELREQIAVSTDNLPELRGLSSLLEWLTIKEDLPNEKRDWLTYEEFTEFCNQRGLHPAAHEALADYLQHTLGLMLLYRHYEALSGDRSPEPSVGNGRNLPHNHFAGGAATRRQAFGIPSCHPSPGQSIPQPALTPYLLSLMRKVRTLFPP